jgi:plasmid replication initiation protein
MEQLHANYLVVKSNTLISARYSLDITEARIVLSMIALIEPHDEDFNEYELSVKNILDISGLHNSKDEYARTKEALESLLSKVLHIPKEDGYLLTHWVSSARYIEKKGIVKLCFDPKLKPYLLGLKQHFTQYPLKYVLPIRSSYSVKIYEMLKMELMGKKEGKIKKTIQELRYVLDLEKTDKYKNYADLKRRMIEPARKHLERYTDIGFFVEEKKEGKSVSTVIFNVYEVKQYTRLLGEPADIEEQVQIVAQEPAEPVQSGQFTIKPIESFKNDTDPEYEAKYSLLKKYGINRTEASKIANEKTLQVINDAIEKLNDMDSKKEIRTNKAGLLVKLINEEASLLSDVDKEKRRLAQARREKEARADYEKMVFEKARQAFMEYKRNNISQWLEEVTEEDYQTYFEHYKDHYHKPASFLPSGELDRVECKKDSTFQVHISIRQKREDIFYAEYVRKNFGKGVSKINGERTLVDLN